VSVSPPPAEKSSLPAAIGRGVGAGLLGTVVMTAFQKVTTYLTHLR